MLCSSGMLRIIWWWALFEPGIGNDTLSRGVGKQLITRCIRSKNSEGLNMDEFITKKCLRLRFSKHKPSYCIRYLTSLCLYCGNSVNALSSRDVGHGGPCVDITHTWQVQRKTENWTYDYVHIVCVRVWQSLPHIPQFRVINMMRTALITQQAQQW